MSAFEVTPSELDALAGQLSGLLSELSAATAIVSSSSSGAAQNGQLEAAIDSFASGWRSGLGDLQRKLDEFSSRLKAAAAGYQGAEDGIAGSFGS
jgi:uncharacterized protein YukE